MLTCIIRPSQAPLRGRCFSLQCRMVTHATCRGICSTLPCLPSVTATRHPMLPRVCPHPQQTRSDLRLLRPTLPLDGTFRAQPHYKPRLYEVALIIYRRRHWMDQGGWICPALSHQYAEFPLPLGWALEEFRSAVLGRVRRSSDALKRFYSITIAPQSVREHLLFPVQPPRHQ